MDMRFYKRILAAALLAGAFLLCGCTETDPGNDPGSSNKPSGSASGVVINEVVSSNSLSHIDPKYGSLDWIEFKNTGSADVDISGWRVSDTPSLSVALTFPEGTVIPAGSFLTVLCRTELPEGSDDDGGALIAPFGISRSGEKLYLSSGENRLAVLDVPYLTTDVSYARRPDGTYGFSATPTFGAENVNIAASLDEALSTVVVEEDKLRISELVIGSLGWVELRNASSEEVNLSLYTLSDNESDPMKWTFPEMTLAPGEFVVVELNLSDPESPLTASFKVSHSEAAIFLFNSMRQLVDSMTVDPAVPDGVSAVAVGDGVAYTSRITKGLENSAETFAEIGWKKMELSDPSVRLYINEVCPDNKYGIVDSYGDRSDWVELYNPSDYPAYLSDYFLSDDVADPMKWRLPEVTLLPGEYVLVFLSGNETIGDEIHASFKLSKTEGGVWLSCLNGMTQDCLSVPGDLVSNASVGRNESLEIRYYAAPTPGEANTTYGFEKSASILSFDPNSLYISEVLAVTAPRSSGSDWVEIVNCSSSARSLQGFSLTDDPDEPRKFTFGGTVIEAGGFSVVYCDSGSVGTSSVARFSISNSGDTIYLISPEGAVVDVFQTGMTTLGVSSGRADRTQTGDRCFFAQPTPGQKNGTPLEGYVHEPVFVQNMLSYSSPATVEITCATEDAEIHYTTDGSIPTRDSKLYSGPLTVMGNMVIKAKAFRSGLISSPTATHTYLINENFSLPVVSLSLSAADYARMYKAEMGPNGGVTHGDQVSCFMEYYIDGKLAVSSGAGVRVSGASTSVYAQKSLGLYFRAGYGRSTLDYPLFDGCPVTSFRSIVLRNAGQDASHARIRDSYLSKICQGMNIDVSYFRPVIVFINGDYRGIYDMKENLNEDYLAGHFGVARNTVEIIKRNSKVMAGGVDQWNYMRKMCQTLDFSKQDNFDKLAALVDTDSVMDYLIARTYFYDADMYNQKYWHTNDNKVKWRAIFFDSDYAMFTCEAGSSILGSYFNPNGVPSAHGFITNMDIYCALNQNPCWRDEFITRYIYYAKHVFDSDHATAAFDELVAVYTPEIGRHITRWHMMSASTWTQEVAKLRACIQSRPSYALRNLKNFYHLTDAQFAEYERLAEEYTPYAD